MASALTNTPAAGKRGAITARAVSIGLLITVFVNVGSPMTEALAFSNFSWSYLPEGGVVPFLALVAVNAGLRRWAPRRALSKGELLTIFVMGLAANCTSLFLMFFHLSAIVSPHYFASPANGWLEQLLPKLPPDLIVNNKDAALWFYEGLPPGKSIPWGAWLIPLSRWLPFLIAMLLTTYALVALFRKPWREQERLSYPLMQLPLLLVEGRTGPLEKPLAGSGWFWAGMALPVGCTLLYVMQHLVPTLPGLPVDHIGSLDCGTIPISERAPWVVAYLRLNFLALGVAYFVPTQLLFSVWVFYLVRLLEEVAVTILGIDLGSGGMFTWGNACMAWQSGGAFFALGASVVYAARRHLWETFRAAIAGRPGGDDVLSPRWAWGLLVGGSLGMSAWLTHYHLPLAAVALFLPAVLLIYLGISRVVCDAGIYYFVPPLIGQSLCIYTLGSRAIGGAGMLALGLSYSWHGDVQTVLPALAAQSFRLRDAMGCKGRQLTGVILLAVVVGLFTTTVFIISFGYHTRAISWNTWVFKGWGPNTYGQVLSQIQNPFDPSMPHLAWFAGGASAAGLLTLLRLRYPWFPLHPMGLAVASSFTVGVAVWMACLVAWLAKIAIMRWGGLRTYRQAAPFFIGLCVGHFAARVIAIVTASAFGVNLG